jgi:hypothetical protein
MKKLPSREFFLAPTDTGGRYSPAMIVMLLALDEDVFGQRMGGIVVFCVLLALILWAINGFRSSKREKKPPGSAGSRRR